MKSIKTKIKYIEYREPQEGEPCRVYLEITTDETGAQDLFDTFSANGEIEIILDPPIVENFKPNYETR